MQKKIIGSLFYLALFLNAISVSGQIGGSRSFNFLNFAGNAPLTAIGGMNVSVRNIYQINQNPALISKDWDRQLVLSNTMYLAGINTTSLQYVHDLGKYGPIGINMNYYTSGSMEKRDEQGNMIGNFSVSQYYVSLGTAHTQSYYTLGLNLKVAGSHIDGYNSFASMADIGGLFKHPERDFTIGLVFKNLGFVINQYTENKTKLPFDVQLGTSYKLDHMPFRFSLLAHHLHIFDIVYQDPNKKMPLDANGNPVEQKKTVGDKILRHFTLGGEFLIGKFMSLKVGYNHLVRREMRLEDRGSGMAGFSFGVLLSIRSFEIAYARDWQHVAGGFNTLTLKTDLSKLTGKKKSNSVQQ